MRPEDFRNLTLTEAAAALRAGTTSAAALAKLSQARVDEVEPSLHAFLRTTPTLSQASAVDSALASKALLLPLAGLPIAIKDNLATAGIETTAGSKILSGYIPATDATVVAKLKAQAVTIIGKTNLDEFAMGSSTENSAFGPTKNPRDLTRVPGGSSGGSAAAVASGEVLAALGSDTGGSVRQPAAFCGIVGFKPSYGRVSRSGLIALTSSTDVVGTLTKTVADAAIMLQAIAGTDPLDQTTLNEPVPDYSAALAKPIGKLRIGIPKECFGAGLDSGVHQAVDKAIMTFRELGATVEECSLPLTPQALWVYYIVTPAEASTNLSRYDGIRYPKNLAALPAASFHERIAATRGSLFGPEPIRRILLGAYALSSGYYDAYYDKAQRVRQLIKNEYAAAFEKFDLLLTPSAPSIAFPFGAKHDPLSLYMQDVYLVGASLAGLPAISIPCGLSEGLPVGVQLIGAPFTESVVLAAGAAYESARGPLPLTLAL